MAREKAISSPQELMALFRDYQAWCKDNPYKQHAFVGKDADEVEIKKERPYTWIGFEGWLANEGVLQHLGHYEQNSNDSYTDFLPIIRVIKRICSADVIDGALAGVYNQNIAARLEGLSDKKEVDKKVTKVNFTDGAG